MAEREWKPGDVARLTMPSGMEHIALRVGWPAADWISATEGGLYGATSIRPLVVIDPEDREQVEQLRARWLGQPDSGFVALQAALREFANPTPPKPAEPTGLGAVVQADNGTKFVRMFSHDVAGNVWRRSGDKAEFRAANLDYRGLSIVRVLSEGVTQ